MVMHFLDLDFRKSDPKFPGPPHVQFYVKSHCKDEDSDWPIISANCVILPRPERNVKPLCLCFLAACQHAAQHHSFLCTE